jgi:hypothetical protein
LKVEGWEFDKEKVFKVFGTKLLSFGEAGVRFFGAVNFTSLINICSGYSLQSFFASKAGKKRISASIPQPFGRKSLFIFYRNED